MIRFIRELFNPKLKCARVGHRIKKRNVAVKKRDDRRFWVLVEHEAVVSHCSRCGGEHGIELGQYIRGFNSVTMPDEMWDVLRKQGFLIDREL